jgi:chromate transporter
VTTLPVTKPTTLQQLLWAWLSIGLQSFGGGTATLTMIRRTSVEEYGWLTGQEFTRYWGICQIAPGINLLGITILIGWKVAGARGAAITMLGLLLPSVSITIALTAAYAAIRDLPIVQSATRGIIPATCGLGLLLVWRMARPPIEESRNESNLSLVLSVLTLIGCALLVGVLHAPVIGVLWGAGAIVALAAWARSRARQG